MRIAILSCGPSLSRYDARTAFDVRIAVNKAALFAPCSYWSVGDSETVGRYLPALDVCPSLWTHHDTYRRVCGHHGWVDAKLYPRSERIRWTLFSATAALWLAKELGATRVDCYGCDMGGDLNWDGTPEPTANRSIERWALERAAWDETVALMEGVEVIRHGLTLTTTCR
jgi:hypothetical protein